MAGKKAGPGRKGKGKATTSRNAVPDVYQEMLAEALPIQSDVPDRPLKKRRTGKRAPQTATLNSAKSPDLVAEEVDEDEDEDLQFEDVLAPHQEELLGDDEFAPPPKQQQTAYRDSDEESQDGDLDWEGLDFDTKLGEDEASGDLELTLTKRTPQPKTSTPRRRVVSKAEKVTRVETHKMHVLCLLSHLDRRNNWCNDPETKASLRSLLDKKTLNFLRPRSDLSQFGQTESLKRGLEQACVMWRTKFKITSRSMRRALWAEDDEDLENVSSSIAS